MSSTVTITTGSTTAPTVTIVTGKGSATQTISTGARGPAGPPGGGSSITSYATSIATLPDYPASFPTTPANIGSIGANKLIGRHTGTSGAGQEIGIDGGLSFQGGNLKVDLATTPSTWRTELGLGSLATLSSVSLTSNVTGTLPVANGGTGGATTADARTNLGLGTLATLSSVSLTTNVTGTLPLANGGTGGTDAAGARTNLGLGTLATLSSVSLTSNVTGTLPIANGGTGATDAATARTNLGLGSVATLSSISLTSNVTGTLPIANGGTGGATAADARAGIGAVGLTGSETIAGAKTFSGQMELTGQAATNSTSAMTRALGDARFAPISNAKCSTSDISSTTVVPADVPGLTGFQLEANTWYRLEFGGRVTSVGGASWTVELGTSNAHAAISGLYYPSIFNSGLSTVGQASIPAPNRITLLTRAATTGTAIPNFSIMIFKTGSVAPTCKITFSQWAAVTGTATLLTDAVACFTKLPI